MSKNIRRILIISHAASRTGAPLLLLHVLQELKRQTDWQFEIALLRSGPLAGDFGRLGRAFGGTRGLRIAHELETLRAGLPHLHPRLRPLRRLEPLLRLIERCCRFWFQKRHHAQQFDLIVSNTAGNGAALRLLSRYNCPRLTYVHELDYALALMGERAAPSLQTSARFIAVSRAVEENLIGNHRVAPEKIAVVYGGVRMPDFDIAAARNRFRQELGIGDEAFVVAGCGAFEWRKAADWFVQVAAQSKKLQTAREVHFVWVGGDLNSVEFIGLKREAGLFGVEENVHFVGAKENAAEFWAACDAFALTSREDPFPLVCLEAAVLGKPVLCFEKAGGMPEFVEVDCGFVVPFGDIEMMARRIVELAGNPHLCRQLGEAAAQRVREQHEIGIIAGQIQREVEAMLEAR